MPSVSEADLAYAAGLFDGEGTITIAYYAGGKNIKSKYPRYSLRAEIGQTDAPALKWMQEKFGGSLRKSTKKASYNGKPYTGWDWCLATAAAASFLQSVSPYLKIKAEEAALAIRFQSSMMLTRRQRLPSNIVEFRKRCFDDIRALRFERKIANAAR